MRIKPLNLSGVLEITLAPHTDERGFLVRTYDEEVFKDLDIKEQWPQENHSRNDRKSILRGLHFYLPPHSEAKLIRVVRGEIYDVFVDLRGGSSTFGKWGSAALSEEDLKWLYIPKGFAHGFCTLTERADVIYKHERFYDPAYDSGILWNDTTLNIEWPTKNPVLSERDRHHMTFQEFVRKYGSL